MQIKLLRHSGKVELGIVYTDVSRWSDNNGNILKNELQDYLDRTWKRYKSDLKSGRTYLDNFIDYLIFYFDHSFSLVDDLQMSIFVDTRDDTVPKKAKQRE